MSMQAGVVEQISEAASQVLNALAFVFCEDIVQIVMRKKQMKFEPASIAPGKAGRRQLCIGVVGHFEKCLCCAIIVALSHHQFEAGVGLRKNALNGIRDVVGSVEDG